VNAEEIATILMGCAASSPADASSSTHSEAPLRASARRGSGFKSSADVAAKVLVALAELEERLQAEGTTNLTSETVFKLRTSISRSLDSIGRGIRQDEPVTRERGSLC
jgi:hypothetical protein